MMRSALFQEKLGADRCRCHLCPHNCNLKPGQSGLCRVRRNDGGDLRLLNYGQVSSLALDPIEKKPLYHFFPGRNILSTGSWGCNFACPFCQNHSIAHGLPPTRYFSPEEMLAQARQALLDDSIGLAFTYNEPLIWFEYILDVARLLKDEGQQVVLVTNGFINPEPLRELMPFVDAANIDLKAIQDRFYRHMCKARIEPVKDNIAAMAQNIHIEVTTLVIPGENDGDEEMEALASWLASIGKQIPLHLSRYHPAYKMMLPPTPEDSVHRLQAVARKHLDFVYVGNLAGEENDTACIQCGNLLVQRSGYRVRTPGISGGFCSHCHSRIDYIKGLEE